MERDRHLGSATTVEVSGRVTLSRDSMGKRSGHTPYSWIGRNRSGSAQKTMEYTAFTEGSLTTTPPPTGCPVTQLRCSTKIAKETSGYALTAASTCFETLQLSVTPRGKAFPPPIYDPSLPRATGRSGLQVKEAWTYSGDKAVPL